MFDFHLQSRYFDVAFTVPSAFNEIPFLKKIPITLDQKESINQWLTHKNVPLKNKEQFFFWHFVWNVFGENQRFGVVFR